MKWESELTPDLSELGSAPCHYVVGLEVGQVKAAGAADEQLQLILVKHAQQVVWDQVIQTYRWHKYTCRRGVRYKNGAICVPVSKNNFLKVAAMFLKFEIRLYAHQDGMNTQSGTKVISCASDWLVCSELCWFVLCM